MGGPRSWSLRSERDSPRRRLPHTLVRCTATTPCKILLSTIAKPFQCQVSLSRHLASRGVHHHNAQRFYACVLMGNRANESPSRQPPMRAFVPPLGLIIAGLLALSADGEGRRRHVPRRRRPTTLDLGAADWGRDRHGGIGERPGQCGPPHRRAGPGERGWRLHPGHRRPATDAGQLDESTRQDPPRDHQAHPRRTARSAPRLGCHRRPERDQPSQRSF